MMSMDWIGQGDEMAKGKYAKWLEGENLILLQGWARDGLTDEQIAHNMGITPSTLYEWKKKFSEISDTLKSGKEVADRAVENALYKSACGYDYQEITKERRFNKATGQYELMVVKTKTVHVQPSQTAQIFWLKNRKPDRWKDKREQVVSTKDGVLADLISGLREPEEEHE